MWRNSNRFNFLKATAGGARFVDNVDSSQTALQSGRVNYKLNSLPCPDRNFHKYRVDHYLRLKGKKFPHGLYDLIIIDPSPPPSHLLTPEDKLNQFYVPPFRQIRSTPLRERVCP